MTEDEVAELKKALAACPNTPEECVKWLVSLCYDLIARLDRQGRRRDLEVKRKLDVILVHFGLRQKP